MIAACLSSALSLNSCIEEVFPESSTATIDQIGKSDQAISAMVNSVVAFINAFRSYGPRFYHDFGYSGYNLIRESACEDFFCHEPKFDFFDTYGVCNDLGDADVVNTIWYYNYKFLNNVNNALSASVKAASSHAGDKPVLNKIFRLPICLNSSSCNRIVFLLRQQQMTSLSARSSLNGKKRYPLAVAASFSLRA